MKALTSEQIDALKSETFLHWRDTEGWRTIKDWAPGPPEEIGKRALLAYAAWVRSREQVEVSA